MATNSSKGTQTLGPRTLFEEIFPFCRRHCTPEASPIASIRNCIVNAPIGIGIVAYKVMVVTAAHIVFFWLSQYTIWHIAFCTTAFPSTRAPCEVIDPAAVTCTHILIAFANKIILLLGKTPETSRALILQIAFREMDLTSFTNREQAWEYSIGIYCFRSFVLGFICCLAFLVVIFFATNKQ